MTRLPRLEEILVAAVAADSVVASLVLEAAGGQALAVLVPVVAALLVLWYLRSARAGALAALGAVLFAIPQTVVLASRPAHAPVQDGLLVTEAAAGRLLAGLSPYGHDYLDDARLRAFFAPELPVNPLLGHYPYPPGPILLALPWHLAGIDFAWMWLPALAALGAGAWLAAGRAGLVAVSLSPLLLFDYLYLFNDLFFIAATLASIGLLGRGRPVAAGLLLGLAILLKQPALLLAPLLLVHAGPGRIRFAAAAAVVGVAGSAPFMAWAPAGFLTDTLAYFYGSGTDSFPIRGPGLPGLLLDAGVLPSRWGAYPAGLAQGLVLVPLFGVAAWDLRGRPSRERLFAWLGLEMVVVFALGRTLAPNYVTLAGLLLGLAYCSAVQDRAPALAGRGVDRAPGPRRV